MGIPPLRGGIRFGILAAIRFNQRVIGVYGIPEAPQHVVNAVISVGVPLKAGQIDVKGHGRIVQ